MRAKKVYENIDFERGKDPMTAMGIGDKRAQYEKKMEDFLEQLDQQAAKFGFVDDMKTHEKNWPPDTWETDGEIEHYIRSYVKPSTIFNRRMPRVKLGLREILDYDENDTSHYATAPIFYILYSDSDHPIDKPGEGWSGFSTEGKLLNWANDYPWEKLLKKGKAHKWDRQMEREARRDARKDKRKLRKKARIIKESVDFERGQDPLKAMGLGLYSIVDKECMELGLTRKAMIPIIADSGGPKIGEMSQWSDKYMANFVEFRTEKGEEPELILGNSEDGFDTITGAEEISDYIRTGKLSKFINLE